MELLTIVTPGAVRLALAAGLVAHKVVWEVLKRDTGHRASNPPASRSTALVKALKMFVLALLIVQTLFLDILPLRSAPDALRTIGLVVFSIGWAIAVVARLQLGHNWANIEDSTVRTGQSLVVHGLYRYIRHPIYTGDILLLIGLELALNSWLVLAVLAILVVVVRQAATEEALLARAVPGYREYRARTKRFIPRIV